MTDNNNKIKIRKTVLVDVDELKEHPENYKSHPDDQVEHIEESMRENGVYRNVVVAKDNTILAGHGVIKAAKKLGVTKIPVTRLNIKSNSAEAKKILIGDNEMQHLSEIDDRALTNMLKEIKMETDGLLGTGFDEKMLANLVFITRNPDEIKDFDAAAEWAGLPGYENPDKPFQVMVSFRTLEDKMKFARILGVKFTEKTNSLWWPHQGIEDVSALKFE